MPESNYFVFKRTEAEIRADFDARANAGMTPDDPEWVDTRVGSVFYICTQPMVIELAAGYDRMNEIVAAAIIATSWGEKLDLHAAALQVEREAATFATGEITFNGENGTLIGVGATVGVVQTDPEVEPPIFETTESGTISGGALTLAIQAVEEGEAGNVAAGAITLLHSAIDGDITSITNADPTGGGQEVESDLSLKRKISLKFAGANQANIAGYEQEALRWPTVGRVLVEPAWDGPGTVRVVVMEEDGDPVDLVNATVDGKTLQEYLDPVPQGEGKGWAPINHFVTVATITPVSIFILAEIEFKPNFSLDGDSGTNALRTPIETALLAYVNGLQPGEDVIYNAVIAAIMSVDGVLDVNDTVRTGEVDPPTGIVDIAIDPTEAGSATIAGIDLTEA